MQTSAKQEVQLLVDGLKRVGVRHIVSSPGSRNAPLSIAFDAEPSFEVYVVPDERVAAFVAMGIAQQTSRPVAISCTSGSAPLNYYPAIAEAFYQGTPLVVLTADRPSEWINQGDGQTIMQERVFGQHVLAFAQLDPFDSLEDRKQLEHKINQTLLACNGQNKGPVHLNIPFSEPLYELSPTSISMADWHDEKGNHGNFDALKLQLEELLVQVKRPMLILGQNCQKEEWAPLLEKLVIAKGAVVLNEHTSNVFSELFIDGIDRVLNQCSEEELQVYSPDVLITFGNAVISKRIKRYFRSIQGLKTIRVAPAFPEMDTYRSLVLSIQDSPKLVLECCNQYLNSKDNDYQTFWNKKQGQALKSHTVQIDQTPFSDLWVIDYLTRTLPPQTRLHISNSSIIRYVLLTQQRDDIIYRCNRGTSGIDGSSSTAVGAALADPEHLHVLVTGDMSFFYDSNAFWLEKLPENLKVIVVNNGGGDIFNIIPGPQSTPQGDRFFVAKHKRLAQPLLEAFGVPCQLVSSKDEVIAAFGSLLNEKQCSALEINTMAQSNSAVLMNYFEATKIV